MIEQFQRNDSIPAAPAEQDVVAVIKKIQQQLVSLERKIDALIGRHPHNEIKQENRFRERALHKAICADCHKECEVPFRPSGERPVSCKDCFSKRKQSGPFKTRPDHRPRVAALASPAPHINKPEAVEKKKPAIKKKPVSRKKKK